MSKAPKGLQDETIQAIFLWGLVNGLQIQAINSAAEFEQGGVVLGEAHQGGEIVISKERNKLLTPDFTEATISMDFAKQKGIQALGDLRDSLSFQSEPPFKIMSA